MAEREFYGDNVEIKREALCLVGKYWIRSQLQRNLSVYLREIGGDIKDELTKITIIINWSILCLLCP